MCESWRESFAAVRITHADTDCGLHRQDEAGAYELLNKAHAMGDTMATYMLANKLYLAGDGNATVVFYVCPAESECLS